MFYGKSVYGTLILRYTAISSFFASIYMVISVSLQSLNKFKVVYISSGIGFLLNAILDVPFMYMFHLFGLNAFMVQYLQLLQGIYLVLFIVCLN